MRVGRLPRRYRNIRVYSGIVKTYACVKDVLRLPTHKHSQVAELLPHRREADAYHRRLITGCSERMRFKECLPRACLALVSAVQQLFQKRGALSYISNRFV